MAFYRHGRTPRLLYATYQEFGSGRIERAVHRHPNCTELCYVYLGVGEYTVGDEIYEVGPGDLLLYNQGDLHELSSTAAGCEIGAYGFGVTDVCLEGLPDGHLCAPGAGFVRPAGDARTELNGLCALLFGLADRKDPESREIARHLLSALVLLAAGLPADERAQAQSAELALAARIRSTIALHFQEPLTLEAIGAAVGVSPYYASHVFKAVFHISPIQYMIRCRVGEAQNLLITSDFSATQIAAMVGYSSANHFHAIFTKTVGLTPIRYRKWYLESMRGKRAQ